MSAAHDLVDRYLTNSHHLSYQDLSTMLSTFAMMPSLVAPEQRAEVLNQARVDVANAGLYFTHHEAQIAEQNLLTLEQAWN